MHTVIIMCECSKKQIITLLGVEEADFYFRLAKKIDKQEGKNKKTIQQVIDEWLTSVINSLTLQKVDAPKFPEKKFLDALTNTMFHTEILEAEAHEKRAPSVNTEAVRMRAEDRKKRGSVIKKTIKQKYLDYLRTKKTTRQNKKVTKEVADAYYKAVKSFYEKQIRKIDESNKIPTPNEIAEELKEVTSAPRAQTNRVIREQTTATQNKVRIDFYSPLSSITHFVFMAIRDSATTEWCNTRRGLVYEKNSTLFEKESPPIHWNCRSEVLPLDVDNPRHLKMINDKSRARASNNPKPLPKEYIKP